MRQDMHKVVSDLARGGSFFRNRKSRLRLGKEALNSSEETLDEQDFGPRQLGMSQRTKHRKRFDEKSSGNRLNPLQRFLHSRVGRLWDKVRSEISSNLDNRSFTRGLNVWIHIDNLVRTDCYLAENGEIYVSGWNFKVNGLYVHPVTGILMYKQRETYKDTGAGAFARKLSKFGFNDFYSPKDRAKDLQNFRIASELEVLEKKNGCWFIHVFDKYKVGDVTGYTWNTSYSMRVPVIFTGDRNSNPLHRISTRQLGKKDLRKHAELIAGNPF